MAKYGKKAQKKVGKVMRERKRGTLKSGSGKKVTSKKQAVAIGLAEARREGAKVPAKKTARKKASKKKATRKAATKKTAKKKATRKAATRKKASRKSTTKRAAKKK